MRDKGCKYVFMEASSHGIVQERLSGIRLRGAIFTNISRDHLDYHGSMDEYVRAKKKLFDQLPRNAFALCNWDDRHGRTMTMHCSAKVHGYALKTPADYQGKILEGDFNGSLLRFNEDELWTPLIGPFNAYNLLAIYGAAELLGLSDKQQMLTALSLLKAVSGRFQHVQSDQGIIGIVDYAHTPDALENVCKTIQYVTEKGQRLMVVVGCGGDRDAGKRPMMAQIAARYAHRSIFTADNPRVRRIPTEYSTKWKPDWNWKNAAEHFGSPTGRRPSKRPVTWPKWETSFWWLEKAMRITRRSMGSDIHSATSKYLPNN